MSRNRRKNANTIRVATFIWWVMVFAGLGILGLTYVSIKNQAIVFGDQRRVLERRLSELTEQNLALGSQVTALTSRSALEKQVNNGFIQLVEIDPLQIVRISDAANGKNMTADTVDTSRILARK